MSATPYSFLSAFALACTSKSRTRRPAAGLGMLLQDTHSLASVSTIELQKVLGEYKGLLSLDRSILRDRRLPAELI
jgi:hypothetical protein